MSIERNLRLALHQLVEAIEYTPMGVRGIKAMANARKALAEAQQPATGEPVVDVRCEGCGYMTHHREHMGCVRAAKQHTHPAPSVPDDVVRDAERYRWLRDHDHWPAPFSSSQEPEPVRGRDLDAAIDAAKEPK